MTPPLLRGERVALRPLAMDDLPFCHAFINDPELRGWLRPLFPTTLDAERAWLEGTIAHDEAVWAIDDGGRQVGIVGLHALSHVHRHAELGIGILDGRARGRGAGGEAIRLALGHGFGALDLRRVYLQVLDDNPARRLYERLGFTLEGRLRRHAYKRGAARDELVYGMLAEEWRA